MQRRVNGGSSGGEGGLPITKSDLEAKKLGAQQTKVIRHKTRKRGPGHKRNLLTVMMSLCVIALLGYVGLSNKLQSDEGGSAKGNPTASKYDPDYAALKKAMAESEKEMTAALSRFPYVNEVLDSSELIALYFAASWCPESEPITELLADTFTPDMLGQTNNESGKSLFEIVYVSSDDNIGQVERYISPKWKWRVVPFESESNERTELKRYFKTCAAREASALEVDRKNGIPTLIIIDGKTHAVLTSDGVSDVREFGKEAFERWQSTMYLLRGLEGKFYQGHTS
uniref:protein-disulfide reductase n=1 Tax=Leptocylindrus danicus TaxID=163516 RepID=A0A7S2K259_9STRA|mmetsp:Transcript_14971/g.22106  ORF Transcript_14971/g.22106 Transcript_14971/m.22106 type:complete len:284 (+) Transcript_14971:113-964(+)